MSAGGAWASGRQERPCAELTWQTARSLGTAVGGAWGKLAGLLWFKRQAGGMGMRQWQGMPPCEEQHAAGPSQTVGADTRAAPSSQGVPGDAHTAPCCASPWPGSASLATLTPVPARPRRRRALFSAGRGRQVIAVCKSADLLLMVLDAGKPHYHREILTRELEAVSWDAAALAAPSCGTSGGGAPPRLGGQASVHSCGVTERAEAGLHAPRCFPCCSPAGRHPPES